MTNNVFQKVLEFGKSLGSDSITLYHILFGYAKLSSMNPETLHVLFTEEECHELEQITLALEDAELDLRLVKAGFPLMAPRLIEASRESDSLQALVEKLEKDSTSVTPDEIIQRILKDSPIDLSTFQKGNTMNQVIEQARQLNAIALRKKAEIEAAKKGEDVSVDPSSNSIAEGSPEEASDPAADAPQGAAPASEGTSSGSAESSSDSSSTASAGTAASAAPAKPAGRNPKNKDSLSFLSTKYSKLLVELLDTIRGQDHAVVEFVQGCFQSDFKVKSGARKKPGATFFLMGPSGVGKTYLAETAVKLLKKPSQLFNMSNYIAPYPDTIRGFISDIVQFAQQYPDGALIFDEVEKAHPLLLNRFLEILDRGEVSGVSLESMMLIFTSNVGHSLYEENASLSNLSLLPKTVLVDAMEHDENPATREPYLSAPLCSRFAAGNIIMFNNLPVSDLSEMANERFQSVISSMEERYNLTVSYDESLPLMFLYGCGNRLDGRIVSNQSEIFIKNEIYEILRQKETSADDLDKLKSVYFCINEEQISPELKKLFTMEQKPEILILCNEEDKTNYVVDSEKFVPHYAATLDEVKEALSNDISLILVDPFCGRGGNDLGIGIDDMDAVGINTIKYLYSSELAIPYYAIQPDNCEYSIADKSSFSLMGVSGVVYANESFSRQIVHLSSMIYMEHQKEEFNGRGYVLNYNSAQQFQADSSSVSIVFHDFKKVQSVDAESRKFILLDSDRPDTKFDDVIGAESAKDEMQVFVEFLKNPKAFIKKSSIRPPKGILLYGPPGTGKTMLARALAGEADATFIQTSAASFKDKYVGETEANIRRLFERAKQYAPSIIFIDEIDAIGKERTGSDTNAHTEEALNQLLTEMDGFTLDIKKPVFVLAATNFAVDSSQGSQRALDPALLRRFDNKIYVDLPNKEERALYIRKMCKRPGFENITEEGIKNIAERSTGLSLAILQNVLQLASRECMKVGKTVDDEALLQAFENYQWGEKKDWNPEYYREVAHHESGHAYINWLSGEVPSYMTIESRGNFGGYMQHADNEDKPNLTREDILWDVRCSMAGRASEQEFFDASRSTNSGISGDLRNATSRVMHMLCSYGMDDMMFAIDPSHVLQGPLAEKYMQKTSDIISEQMLITKKLIRHGRDKVAALAAAVLDSNFLKGDDIRRILGEPPTREEAERILAEAMKIEL